MPTAVALSPSHENFAQHYAVHGHAMDAAVAAGFTARTGYAIADREDVVSRVQQIQSQRFSKLSIRADRVLVELARIAFGDIRGLYDPATGELLPIHALPDDVAATISQVKVEVVGSGPANARQMAVVKTIKTADKMAALALLARHFKIVGDAEDGVNAFATALADRLNQAKRRDHAEDARVVDPTAAREGVQTTYALPDDPSNARDVTSPRLRLPVHDSTALHADLLGPTAEPLAGPDLDYDMS